MIEGDLAQRVADLLGAPVLGSHAARGGFTSATRARVELSDGRRAFIKEGPDAQTAGWLRTEARVYNSLAGDWRPKLLAWEDGERPLLILEDLGELPTAPPWTDSAVQAVVRTLAEVAAVEAPAWLPLARETGGFGGWARVAAEPEAFLRLCVCTRRWFDGALPVLVRAEAEAELDGSSLLHLDVRGDNLFLRGDRAVLFDWNWAAAGNPALDRAFWAPSLTMQGGPLPEAVVGDEPGMAAVVAGFFAALAGLPPCDAGPRLRAFQFEQLQVALPWACRALRLPDPLASGACFGGLGRGPA